MKCLIGIDIGGTNIKIGIFKTSPYLIKKIVKKIPKDSENDNIVFDLILEAVEELKNMFKIKNEDIRGIGVAIPGPVKGEIVIKCPNIKLENFNLVKKIKEIFPKNKNVVIGNDASLALYGEYKYSKYNEKNIVFYTLGTGVGGGIIINGKLLEGIHGSAGEIGHVIVTSDGKIICGCGKTGCLETVCGTKGILRYTNELLKDNTESSLNNKELNPKVIFDEAKNNDKVALEVIDKMATYLAKSMVIISSIIDPEVYILGGGISNNAEILVDKIKQKYEDNARFNTKNTKITIANLKNDAGMYGAVYLLLDKYK